ncbi:TniQ family protein [Streptomyces microflavus]|uniref:TniQ family protein n=1 Tax=Streptomyces microflavus TaxID=1919 RepID=UPI002DD9DC4A|nr:TniQ family protein [Streptomyces microflavus]WSA58952.1 TniQ family protein [Streptomyces microflavus]
MTAWPLARALSPLPEESLPGLLLRLAYRTERSPARIARLCGLIHRQNRLPGEYLFSLPADRIRPFASAARLNAQEANALTLSPFAAVYPPLASARTDGSRNTTAVRKSWAASMFSRYCAACLSGDGSPVQTLYGGPWKLRWHLPVSYACLTHRTLLSHTCPNCGGTPNRPTNTERQGLITHRTTTGLHPAQCRRLLPDGHGAPAAPCAARLDHDRRAEPLSEADMALMFALQHRIDQHLMPVRSDADAGHVGSDPSFFPDLIIAAHLIRLSWPDSAPYTTSTSMADLIDGHVSSAVTPRRTPEPARRTPTVWDAPEVPAECAAVLLAADNLLGREERDDAGMTERVRPLAASAFSRHPANTGAALRRMHVSPSMARALLGRAQGFYRAGGHRHARQSLPSRESCFQIGHVPALLPQEWLSAHFGDLLSHWTHLTDWRMRHLRRVATLKLAEMSGGGTWPDCAKALDIPWNTAQQSLTVIRQELNSRELWPEFERSVESVAIHMDQHTDRVHYGRRRELLSTWQIPADDWTELCCGLPRFRQGATSPSRDTATVLIWTQVTQGDHLHSPSLGAMRESSCSTEGLVGSINQLRTPVNRKGSKRELLLRIDTYSHLLAAACDRTAASLQAGSPPRAGNLLRGAVERKALPRITLVAESFSLREGDGDKAE